MSKLLVSFERQEPHSDDSPLLYARNKFTLTPSHPYALTFARLSFLLGLITSNIHLCTPLVLQNPDNAPIILTSMQELYLDRLLALKFDESDNGGYARRWACYAEILGFWGESGFWDSRFREVEGDEDWENDVMRRVRWQNLAVERANYEIAMLRLRILFHRGRQYLRGGQNLKRLQRRGVRKMEKKADASWESYKEDLETYPRAMEWTVCETPGKEYASSEQDTIAEDAGADGNSKMVLKVDGMLWKWNSTCLRWIALEALNVEQDTSSDKIRNEDHDDNEEVDEQPDWTANFLGTREESPRKIESSAATQEGEFDVLGVGPSMGRGLFEGWAGFSQGNSYHQIYDVIAEPEPANPSKEQEIFEKLQKLILQPKTAVEDRLEGIRQLTAYTYTNEDREKWTAEDWKASREFWTSEPRPLEKMLEAQDIVPAPDSTAESLLLELIKVGDLKAVLGGEQRTDSGIGLEDDGVELSPLIRTVEQVGVFSQPDTTAEEQLLEMIQQQGVRAIMSESKPVQKVGWIMGRMVLYNPKEEELGEFSVRKLRRSTSGEKRKQRPVPPISLTSFTCHKSTAKPHVNTPDRPSQVMDESTQPSTSPIPIIPVPWTGQPRQLAPYQSRRLTLPTQLLKIRKPSSRDASQDKPSMSHPISDSAPLALFHPNPLAWYFEWENSRTYATAANGPAPCEAGKRPAMKKLARRKKDAEHESPATEQDQNNVIVDEQSVLDGEPGMPSVQSMRELFQLRACQASIGVSVKEGDSRRGREITIGTERRCAFPSPPPPPPPPETSRGRTRQSECWGKSGGRGRKVPYPEREDRNKQQSETATNEGQDIIPEPDIPAVATERALVGAGGAQRTVDEPERQTDHAEHDSLAHEQNRNNEVADEQMALNEEPGMVNDEHRAELSHLDAYRTSIGVAIEYVNSRHDRERYNRNGRGQGRSRGRGGTYRERYPRKWQQMQAAANEGQNIISKPGSSNQDSSVEMNKQEPMGPGQKESLEALQEQSDHPPLFTADSGVERLSRLASLGLEDYASDISEEDADGEAPLASSDSIAYANAHSTIAEELLRVPQSGVTSVQIWAQIVQRETTQEPIARVEVKVQDDHRDAVETKQEPQSATTEAREIISRPRRGRGRGRSKGVAYRERQPRMERQPRAVEIEGQNIISKPDSLPSTQDISEENERRHISMYDLAVTRGADAITELLAQRVAIRDQLIWMSYRMADKETVRDQRIRMVAMGWCRWSNWKDRGGTGNFSCDEEGSWVDFVNPGAFDSHSPFVQTASSAATATNAPIMPRNSAAPSASSAAAGPPSNAPAASSSVLFRVEHKRLKARKLNEARKLRRARAWDGYDAKAETNTEYSIEKPSTSSSQDKGKVKATDFTGASIADAKGPDTTSEDTALQTTELYEVERINDARQEGAFSAATASNPPVISGNSATPSVSAVPHSAASTAFSSFMSEAELLRHMRRNRASAERKTKKAAAAKAETKTKDEMERPSTSSSRDKGKMKATDFRGVPILYAEGLDTSPEDTAFETAEIGEVARINDAHQECASSAASAANAPVISGNSATPSASSTSAVPSFAISTAASPDNWLIRLMRNISPNHHERNRANAKGRARRKALAKAEANIKGKMEKPSTSSSHDKGKMKATNFTGVPIPISYVTDEMKAAERNQIDELAELSGPGAVTGDSMKVEGDASGTSQDTSLVPLSEVTELDTKEAAPPSTIKDAAEPRSRSDSARGVIWGPSDPAAYEDFWNSASKPPLEIQDSRTEPYRIAEVLFGMIEMDGSLACIGEIEKAEDEARRIGQDERFEPNAHQERRMVRPDGTVKFIFQPMFKPPRWNIDHRRPVFVLDGVDMVQHTARVLRQLREQEAKNARKQRIATRTTRDEKGRHAVRQMLDFPAFLAFTTARVDEEKMEDDARRIGQEELFEVEGPRISVQLPPQPGSSCSSVDDRDTHLVGFSDNSELNNN